MDFFLFGSIMAGIFAAVCHEVGHYISARWMGIPVQRITIGMGQKLFTWKTQTLEIQWCVIPFGGQIYIAPEHIAQQSAARIALISAGGFLFNVVLALGAIALWGNPFGKVFFLFNCIVAITCLFPDGGRSDGDHIRTYLQPLINLRR
jgi:membrane-associated protease RseP (regulator of RpoE activity)